MKYIKKFEELNFSQTLPIANKADLTNYYSCDDCDALWKEFNNTSQSCKFCKSDKIEELSNDEWLEIAKSRLDKDEIENDDKFLSIYNMGKNKEDYVN